MDANPARVRCKEGVSWTGGHRAPQKVNFPLQCACAELLFAFLTHFFLPKKHFWPIFGGKMFWPGASPIVIFGAGQILLTQTAPLFRQRLPPLLDRRRGGLTPHLLYWTLPPTLKEPLACVLADQSEFCVDLMVRKPNRSKYDKITHRCVARYPFEKWEFMIWSLVFPQDSPEIWHLTVQQRDSHHRNKVNKTVQGSTKHFLYFLASLLSCTIYAFLCFMKSFSHYFSVFSFCLRKLLCRIYHSIMQVRPLLCVAGQQRGGKEPPLFPLVLPLPVFLAAFCVLLGDSIPLGCADEEHHPRGCKFFPLQRTSVEGEGENNKSLRKKW